MANLKKIKDRLGKRFEERAIKAGEKFKDLIQGRSTETLSDSGFAPLQNEVKRGDVEGAVERLVNSSGDDIEMLGAQFATTSEDGINPNIFMPIAEEAIVEILQWETRPPLVIVEDKIITDGSYEIVNEFERQDLISGQNKTRLEELCKSVGAVDLVDHRSFEYCGTGSLVEKNIVLTNRHVAEKFMQTDGNGSWEFKQAQRAGVNVGPMTASLNFLRQEDTLGRRQVFIEKPLFIARKGEPDMAFFLCRNVNETHLEIKLDDISVGDHVGVIGYPNWDGIRNDSSLMSKIFNYIHGVKRFAPGEIDHIINDEIIKHDCVTLGGNSGSPLIDLQTGKLVGLHFSGRYGEENRAVHSKIVAAALRDVMTMKVFVETPQPLLKKPVRSRNSLRARKGYRPEFLGEGDLHIPLPDLGTHQDDLSSLLSGDGHEIKYHHFSILQSSSRRLPRVSAVNIHGKRLGKVPESNRWHFDPRINLNHQTGNELYKDTLVDNPLDRGHMVRRLDPCWGTKSDIKKAQRDTYHYTNSAPQHLGLNRRHWVGLEDYILDAAKARDFKISVFTGAVFRDSDPSLKSGASDVQIPKEFWKIAALVNAEIGQLSASGYILSQGEMIKDFTEAAFVLGQYRTYQVPISLIETETGYSFGPLLTADVMSRTDETENLFSTMFKRIDGPSDLQIV